MLYGVKQGFARGHRQLDEVSHHLGVSVGNTSPALAGYLFTKRAVIFDNAVVNDRDALVNDMRMSINDRWLAMGRPTCVGDPCATLNRCPKLSLFQR